jgi:DNA-binding CsgD family transcriptional regulator
LEKSNTRGADVEGRLDGLTHRELQVLGLASAGLTNADVARRLTVSVHAVKFHLGSIFRKLGVANRTEAAALYFAASRARNGSER